MQCHGACGSEYCNHKGHDRATCGHTSCDQVTYHTYDCATYLERLRKKHPNRYPLCVVLLALYLILLKSSKVAKTKSNSICIFYHESLGVSRLIY